MYDFLQPNEYSDKKYSGVLSGDKGVRMEFFLILTLKMKAESLDYNAIPTRLIARDDKVPPSCQMLNNNIKQIKSATRGSNSSACICIRHKNSL